SPAQPSAETLAPRTPTRRRAVQPPRLETPTRPLSRSPSAPGAGGSGRPSRRQARRDRRGERTEGPYSSEGTGASPERRMARPPAPRTEGEQRGGGGGGRAADGAAEGPRRARGGPAREALSPLRGLWQRSSLVIACGPARGGPSVRDDQLTCGMAAPEHLRNAGAGASRSSRSVARSSSGVPPGDSSSGATSLGGSSLLRSRHLPNHSTPF